MTIEEFEEKARTIIENNKYMVISSASLQGKPWVSPVFFAHDENFVFYWSSFKDANHSKLISQNPNIAAVVFDSSVPYGMGDGVYFEGVATEVEEGEIAGVLELLDGKKRRSSEGVQIKVRKPEDFTGVAPWRMYKVVPSKFWTLKEPVIIEGFPSELKQEIRLP